MYSKVYETNTSPTSANQEPFLQVSTTDSPSQFPSLHALGPFQKSIVSPLKKSWLRWLILAISTIINFALNYSSNNPQALQPSIQSVLGIEDGQFNMLYSVYSLPNVILPLFGGILADVIGVRFAINLFGFLVLAGQGVFTFGAYRENFQLMVLGRFIFGLGGECLTVTQLPLVAKWFKGGELAFAYGFAKSAVRFGKAANSFFTPKIFLWTNSIFTPLFVGSIVSLVSFVSGLVLCIFDKKADKQEQLANAHGPPQPKKKVNCKDLKSFPRIYYILLGSYAVMFAVFTGLSNTLNKVLVTRFGFETDVAGNVVMLYYFASAIAGPFVGLIVEKYGRLTQMTLVLTITLLLTNLGFAIIQDGSPGNPNYQVVYPMVGVTIFSSFYTILFWACVAAVIDKKKIGLGTGMITCMSNLTQTALPFALGYIHDRTINFHFGYFWTLAALCGLVGVGFILDFWIHCEDKRTGGILSMSKKEEKALGLTSSVNKYESEGEMPSSEDIKSFVDA